MKKFFLLHRRLLGLIAVLVPMLVIFIYVALRSGPLASVPITLETVERREIKPAIFGIGTVEARFTHKVGPTYTGRLIRVTVQPGDFVKAGQLLGEMDPIDLDDKVGAQEASIKRAGASVESATALVKEVAARQVFADTQSKRYESLYATRSISEEAMQTKRQELLVARASTLAADANQNASRQELLRLRAERDGLLRQRANLRLVSPIDGLVIQRNADPGSTVIAGQSVIEVVDPSTIWINVRFDQKRALGLQANLPARIILRSQSGKALTGSVSRVEPSADAVTEEILAKVNFEHLPLVLPSIGELAEVTVSLKTKTILPAVLNACIHRVDGNLGVWLIEDGSLRFAAIKIGDTDLDGYVQILDGLKGGEEVVVYSEKALTARSRVKVVENIVSKKL